MKIQITFGFRDLYLIKIQISLNLHKRILIVIADFEVKKKELNKQSYKVFKHNNYILRTSHNKTY